MSKSPSSPDQTSESQVANLTADGSSPEVQVDPMGLDRRDASWDLRQGPRNYLTLVTTQAASALFSFAAVWIATRYLGAAGYGGVVAVIAASQIVMLLAINWTGATVSRFGCEEFVETGRITSAFWTRLAILLPNLGLVAAAAPLWLPKLSGLLHLPVNAGYLVFSLLIANSLWIHVQQALQGVKLLRLQGSLLTLERALIFLAVGGLAVSGKISVWSVGFVYVLGPMLASTVGLIKIWSFIWPISWVDISLLKRMLRFSFPIIPAAFIGYLASYYLDALFISHFLSQVELGIYAVVFQLSGLTQQLPVLVGTLLAPLFVTFQSGKQENRTARFIEEVLPVLTLLWTMGCALVATVGWYLLPMVFGPSFAQTSALLWPLMAAGAFAGPWLMGYGPITTTAAKTHLITIAVLSGSAANVILNWILIPRFGLLGCAWASAVAAAINLITIFLLVHRSILPTRTWTLQANLPIAVGALIASLTGKNLLAFGFTLLTCVIIAFAHRKSLIKAAGTMSDYRRFVATDPTPIAVAHQTS